MFLHKHQLYCAPIDYDSKKSSRKFRQYFKGMKKDVSFVAKGFSFGKGGHKGNFRKFKKGMDKKTLVRLCSGDLRIKGMKGKDLKDFRRALGCKKMESEDYYDFEVESPYSEDSEDFDFDSEDFDSEDFDSEDFDSEDFDFDSEDFDFEDFDSEDFE